jgi:hypothetical protein
MAQAQAILHRLSVNGQISFTMDLPLGLEKYLQVRHQAHQLEDSLNES